MSVARMREAIFGVGITFFPGYRFSHPGYDVLVIASWDRWIRHRPALDESLRLDVGGMTPFLSDFLPRSEATKQSRIVVSSLWIASLALAMTASVFVRLSL